MKRLVVIFALSSFCCLASERVIIRDCTVSNVVYLVQWNFDDAGAVMIPAVMGPTQVHYSAKVTVFSCDQGKHQIGKAFVGEVTEKGCFEDVPEDQVKIALAQKP